MDSDMQLAGKRVSVTSLASPAATASQRACLVVDVAMLCDLGAVDLQDLQPRLLVGQRDLNLAVQPPRPQQRGVQHVRPVGRHDHLHLRVSGAGSG